MGGEQSFGAELWEFAELREVGEALGATWRGGLVVYSGSSVQRLDRQVWAVPVDRLLA